ncbi:MAG: hypothetical protein H7Z12_04220 [Rhodospirillaceae bacterium]|nr:hypothetical protein [Rhodospirillales bacterium]
MRAHFDQPSYQERLSAEARKSVAVAMRCVHCRCGGRTCLNRNLRLINFATECETEARRRGSFIIARVARALFDVARLSRDWGPDHFSVIEALCFTIRDLSGGSDLERPLAEQLMGERLETALTDVEAWVSWLEKVSAELNQSPSDFVCMRKTTRQTAACPAP